MVGRRLPWTQDIIQVNKPWEVKQWLPNAQSRRERISSLREKYIKVKPVEKVNTNELLFSVGSSLAKQRAREGRPAIYDTFALRSKWLESPLIAQKAAIEFEKLKQWYESKEYKSMKSEVLKFDSSIVLPDDTKIYKDILKERELYISSLGEEIVDQVDKAARESRIEEKMRIFFSNKVSIPEVTHRINTLTNQNKLLLSFKNNSKFRNFSDEEYLSAAYAFLREAIEKNKDSYSSDTVYTAVMSDGIDEYIDENLKADDEAFIKFRESLDSNFGEIQQLRQSILGEEKIAKEPPSFVRVDRERFKQLRNNELEWRKVKPYITDEELNRITGMNEEFDRDEIGALSQHLKTIGQLKYAKEVIKTATENIKGKKYTLENYILAGKVIKDSKGDVVGDSLKLRNLIKSKVSDETLEAMAELLK